MTYGAGWLEGQSVEIIEKIVRLCDGDVTDKTPTNLIGKRGKILYVNDDRYDSEYPTGYEGVSVDICLDDGEEVNVPTYFLKRL